MNESSADSDRKVYEEFRPIQLRHLQNCCTYSLKLKLHLPEKIYSKPTIPCHGDGPDFVRNSPIGGGEGLTKELDSSSYNLPTG